MPIPETRLYALFFLVGCFTVKSLLELQNWSGRKKLWELWILFTTVMAGYDILIRPESKWFLALKWGLLAAVILFFYLKEVDFIVTDDKIALLAAIAVLTSIQSPVMVLIYTGLVLMFKRRLKHGFSHSKKIPTIPLLTSALIFTIVLFLFY